MKNHFRILESKPVEDSYRKMAVDEAVLKEVAEGNSKPTLRFYQWNKPAVAIGYFQSVKKEVDIERCRENEVEIFRRITGGGAVYKDPKGELNYSVIVPEKLEEIPRDIQKSYRKINQFVINALENLGINAEHSGINDIVIDKQKISGSAQTRKKGAVLQHGTLLLDFDPEKMVKYLKISSEKSKDKTTSKIQDRVTTLKQRKPGLKMKELKEELKKSFEKEFHAELIKEGLSNREKERSNKLYKEKYSTDKWNFKR